jgi:hypothetical protein
VPVTGRGVNLRLRRQLPLLGVVLVGALFLLAQAFVVRPLAERYQHAVREAVALGLMLDTAHPATRAPLPPRVFTVLMTNSLPAAEADAQTQSGALAAEMVQRASSLAGQRGLEIVVAEPGPLTPQAGTVEVRAHLKLRGRYASFVGFLDDLASSGRLWALDRFTIVPTTGDRNDIEVFLSSCILKRTRGAS